jgi:hypothetical protein
MLDEFQSHYRGECLADFFPSQLGDLLRNDEAMRQAAEFARGEDLKGFVLVDKEGRDILDKDGKPMPVGPAPLAHWEALGAHVHKISLLMRSNNDVERVFTHASRGHSRGGKNVDPRTISSWVRRKDWITGGFWGKEKDPLFLDKFAKWRLFALMHHKRLQRLFQPDVAAAEEKKMAAQLADLPLKYRNGGRFDESNIRPGKDFFVFGQKEIDPENNDEGAAPPHRKRTSPSVMLRQKAAAKRKAAVRAHK